MPEPGRVSSEHVDGPDCPPCKAESEALVAEWAKQEGRSPSLVDLSTPLPGAPDVSKATDERVFDAAALRDLHEALDRLDRVGIYRRQR